MDLFEAINEYISGRLNSLPEIYNWDFKLNAFPDPEYNKVGLSNYEQSRNLRNFIFSRIKDKSNQGDELQIWYVTRWGGVKGNKPDTLSRYTSSSIEELVALGEKGIASWSKILSLRNPLKYPIYDARVAISLNSIQKKFNVSNPMFFPQLPSRNKKFVAHTQVKIKNSGFFKEKSDPNFYLNYIAILEKVSERNFGFDIQDAEMVLFATAPTISEIWEAN